MNLICAGSVVLIGIHLKTVWQLHKDVFLYIEYA